jgi:uncharacterized membrane protein
MTKYEAFLLIHIVAVIVWLGAGTTLALTGLYAERRGDRLLLGRIPRLGQWLGPRVFGPAALLVLAMGFALVAEGSWSYSMLWIDLGLTAFALTLLTNLAVRLPLLRRLESAEGRGGPESPEALGATGRLLALARLDLTILFLAVGDMVVKPTSDDTWVLVAGALILLAGLVGALVARSRRERLRPETAG